MISRRASAISLALLLTGCGFLSRKQSRFFSLDDIAPASSSAMKLTGTPVGIDVIELPPGLDRREIVVSQPDHQLAIRERDQWSASLEPLVLHRLAVNLANRLGDGMVVLPGQSKPKGPVRSLEVIFERLGAGPGSVIQLDARWSLRAAGGGSGVVYREQITTPIGSLDSADIASGMSVALATLADRMAEKIGKP